MKITKVEVWHCDAGFRPWTFIKISTDEGLVGWSECSDSFGSSRGIEGAVKDLSLILIGQDPRLVEKIYWQMYSQTRTSTGSVIQKAISGIENALLDIKAKALGVSVCELFGGAVREKIPLYWSHCGTSRVRSAEIIKKPKITSLADIQEFGKEIRSSGYRAIKTNIGILNGKPHIYHPGFSKTDGGPELNADQSVLSAIDSWINAFREAVGSNIDIILDLNFNFKTEGYIKIGRMLEKYNLLWLEIDSYNPDALAWIRRSVKTPICSGESLYGARDYRPYFEKQSMDIANLDIIWNGFLQSKKIADLAELHEINFTPHNFNGHLSTFISAQFSALAPNLHLMEYDVDAVPWRDELFTNTPRISNGYLEVPKGPGWGIEVNEKMFHEHPWTG